MLLITAAVSSSAAPRPNIALLYLDDHGWGDLGANNGGVNTGITPEMDKLASDGIRFTDFHVGDSVCTPSRAALLTGRYGLRTGVVTNFAPDSIHGMASSELTIANVLNDVGYVAHMIGKWHLGHNAPHHPTYFGFETFYGLPYSGDMGCLDDTPQGCHADWDRTKGQPACPARCPDDEGHGGCGSAGGSAEGGCVAVPLYDTNGTRCGGKDCAASIVQQPYDAFGLNSRYAERARAIIAAGAGAGAGASAGSRPLFVYVAFAHTHTPLAYLPRWENATARRHDGHSAVFANTLAEVDWAGGEIAKAADESGASWLLWLAGDNGPADHSSVSCDSTGSPGLARSDPWGSRFRGS